MREGFSCFLGVLDVRDDDVTVELPISTLSRILKVTQFHKVVSIICEPGLPVRLIARLRPRAVVWMCTFNRMLGV